MSDLTTRPSDHRPSDHRPSDHRTSGHCTSELRPRRLIVLVPLVLFLGLTALFLFRLNAGDPSLIPSALIGRPVPQTTLPPIAGLKRDGAGVSGLDPASFKGAVSVVNVWASWCVPCHDEAPLLMQLAQDPRLRLVGINYKDDADNARRFLGRYGNPFAAAGADQNGRAAIEWGVYGVPETFIIGRDGRIAYKLVGPITPENFAAVLKPQIEKALAAGS
jgi:cytochrome c biogenesis protein CcmG/thiol:disulfide interchange protein DsbE